MSVAVGYPAGKEEYFRIKTHLWDHFYSLRFGERVSVMFSEMRFILAFLVGWIIFSAYLKYGHPLAAANLMSLNAWAQGSPGSSSNLLNEARLKFYLWMVINLALVVVMVGCTLHMLLATRKNQWVAKTATFLLGFLTKSVSVLMP